MERSGDSDVAKMENWAAASLEPGASTRLRPPPPVVDRPAPPLPAWLLPISWKSETTDMRYATVGGRGCRIEVSRQVFFDPLPDKFLLVYNEETLLASNVSDFCNEHSDDPAVDKHISMRFHFTVTPEPDGTVTVRGTLEDPCSSCSLPRPLTTRQVSGVIMRMADRQFWVTLQGAVFGGFQMRPTN